jgi:hypothetical protein
VISRYRKASTPEYSTATAAASVAVKIPATMPPMTTTSRNRLGRAAKSFITTSRTFSVPATG